MIFPSERCRSERPETATADPSVEQLSQERHALLRKNIFGFIDNTLADGWNSMAHDLRPLQRIAFERSILFDGSNEKEIDRRGRV